MMKITKKRIISLLLASLMLMSVFGTLTASAASKVQLGAKSGTYYLRKGQKEVAFDIYIDGVLSVSDVKNVKVSNPKIATVSVVDNSGIILFVKAKKLGTATISCTAKGKVLKYKLTVCRYVNPFKKLMLGSKNYASLFDKKEESKDIKNPGGLSKLTVKPKKGWKLTNIVGTYWDPDTKGESGNTFDKKIKNGEDLDLSIEWMWIKFTFKNKKGVKEEVTLYFK